MNDKLDKRTFCYRCMMEYKSCGYKLERTRKKYTEECSKCGRQGYEYVLREGT